MMDEHMEEQAALHVLGALSETEAREFKAALKGDPELQEFVARLSAATEALAGAVPLVEPPPHLRAKVLAGVAAPKKIVPWPVRKPQAALWLPWALAACLAIMGAILVSRSNQLRDTVENQAQQIETLNQLARSLESSTNDLRQSIRSLQETNRLVNLRVALLNSLLTDAPRTIGVTLWDDQRQDGVFVAQNLKTLPSDKDYELWVIDEQQGPVAAGVFHVEQNGAIRIEFKPSRTIKAAGKFAVTEEVKGGVSSPTVKNMVLASN